jgi:hypothetical protein
MPKDPTARPPLLRLPAMRRTHAPGLGRTNQQVRRNVPRLRHLLPPKISHRRQPTKTLMMMITEKCHPEEMQAFAGCPHVSRLSRRGPFTFTLSPQYSVIPILCHPERSRGTLCLFGAEQAAPSFQITQTPWRDSRTFRLRLNLKGAPSKLRLGGVFLG